MTGASPVDFRVGLMPRKEAMQTMLIVHKPGECPRIGYLNPANMLASMREWQADNSGAAIYVVQAQELPTPGTGSVYTIEQAIFEAEMAEGPDHWPYDDEETEQPNSKIIGGTSDVSSS